MAINSNNGQSGSLAFTKLHGNGNDFILIDELEGELVSGALKSEFAMLACHRNFGIGSDGVLYLSKSDRADLKMRLFQPDGSEAEMCGNGIRCLAKYAYEAGYVESSFQVETPAGIMPITTRTIGEDFWARVDMGVPRFSRGKIPAEGEGELLRDIVEGLEVSAVNTGVPHAVIFVEELERLAIGDIAPLVRHSSVFPEGVNVNFVKVKGSLQVRTFERGIEGETLSCGTGSVASAAVARKLGMVGDEVFVETRGGPLVISFEGDRAYMDGPAITVYRGELSEEFKWDLSAGL